MPRLGVVYACSDMRWLEETLVSAESVARHMPALAREFYAPAKLLEEARLPQGLFTKLVSLQTVEVSHRPRFEAFLQTDLDAALFLDGTRSCCIQCPRFSACWIILTLG